ncbi:hypothetical protein HDU97_003639 [Phlyctochytrium planicorne]|nr:hypothetical protein HDU97_003639 [Phlyctochytrium planicorne]
MPHGAGAEEQHSADRNDIQTPSESITALGALAQHASSKEAQMDEGDDTRPQSLGQKPEKPNGTGDLRPPAPEENAFSNQTTVENTPLQGHASIPTTSQPDATMADATIVKEEENQASTAIPADGSSASANREKGKELAEGKKTGSVTVQNDERLTKIPEGTEAKYLGHVMYTGVHPKDKSSEKAADSKLYLLPSFNTSHVYSTIDVRIPAEFLSFHRNLGVKHQALWGTEIYTDDSDVVAVLIHSGYYRPFDHPMTEIAAHVAESSDSAKNPPGETSASPANVAKASEETPQDAPSISQASTTFSQPPPAPFQAKRDPTNHLVPDHDLSVTLRILPRLVRYTGSIRFGISSRGWGSSHDGESIRIEKVDIIPRGSASRKGRKRGSLAWSTLGLYGRQKELRLTPTFQVNTAERFPAKRQRFSNKTKVPHNPTPPCRNLSITLPEDTLTLVFSPFGGHPCAKFYPSLLLDWPEHIREALKDHMVLDTKDGPMSDSYGEFLGEILSSFESSYGIKASELKSLERSPYWAIRAKREALYLETNDGKCYEMFKESEDRSIEKFKIQRLIRPSVAAGDRTSIPESESSSNVLKEEKPRIFDASEVLINSNGIEIGPSLLKIPVVRLFWRKLSNVNLMTFYEKKKFNWKSLFELTEDDNSTKNLSSPVLDEAAAIIRTLNSEESVRPMLASPIAGSYDLWNENVQVGDIDLEITFNYGRFGYGYSYQVENSFGQNAAYTKNQLEEEDVKPEEQVQYSLFPRILPPRDQREPDEAVMVVCATPHPKFIPFKEPAYLSYGKDIRDALEEASDLQYKPTAFVKEMSPFEKVRDQYYAISDRVSRLTFLRNYLTTSTNQQETMVPKLEKEEQDKFPAKSYTQFAVPISALKPDGTVSVGPLAGEKTTSNTNAESRAGSALKARGRTNTLTAGSPMTNHIIKSRELISEDDD